MNYNSFEADLANFICLVNKRYELFSILRQKAPKKKESTSTNSFFFVLN